MTTDIFKAIGFGILILLFQVIVLNNIHLFGCATPLLFVYVILNTPRNAPRWAPLVTGFLLGLTSDIFANTPGVAAASMTLVGFLQPMYLQLFLNRESPENLSPALHEFGFTKYLSYSFPLVLLFIVMFFTLEYFTFFNLQQWVLYVVGSTVLTYVIILTIEMIRKG